MRERKRENERKKERDRNTDSKKRKTARERERDRPEIGTGQHRCHQCHRYRRNLAKAERDIVTPGLGRKDREGKREKKRTEISEK